MKTKPDYQPATIPLHTAPSGRVYYISAIFSPTETTNPQPGVWTARIKYTNGEDKHLPLKMIGI